MPAEIRKKLGVGPGSIVEWDESNGQVVVRRAGRYTSADVHRILFSDGTPKRKAPINAKEGIKKHVREKRALR